MTKLRFGQLTLICILLLTILLMFLNRADSEAGICEPDGCQSSGAVYRICMPEQGHWNGDLVIFAHGYVAFNRPLQIPEDQLRLIDGILIPEIINDLGYAFITTSYRTNGLAVRQGIKDVVELVKTFSETHPHPRFTYLIGPSEGGLISALAIEEFPEVFDGAIAACGIIGDFCKQVNYWSDFRVIFDYFFPNIIPGSPINIPQDVINTWDETYVPRIKEAIRSNGPAARQLLRVTNVPIDPNDPLTIENTVPYVLWFNVFTADDYCAKLGGQPFDNMNRLYRGSDNDLLLNQRVQRFSADQAALDVIKKYYQTSGRLARSLVTLHTTRDPIVPYWHEPIYRLKVTLSRSNGYHNNIPSSGYGHCKFKAEDIITAFALLVFKVTGQNLLSAADGRLKILSSKPHVGAGEITGCMRRYDGKLTCQHSGGYNFSEAIGHGAGAFHDLQIFSLGWELGPSSKSSNNQTWEEHSSH